MQQINIKNEETYRLAQELSRISGENLTQAITTAIQERLSKLRTRARSEREGLADSLLALGRECASIPTLDARHPDEILYDEHGLPKDVGQ